MSEIGCVIKIGQHCAACCVFAVAAGVMPRPAPAQQAGAPADDAPELVSVELEHSHLGYTYVGAGGLRYFATQATLTNTSGRNLNIRIADFELQADGLRFQPDIGHPKLAGYNFSVDRKSYRFRDLEQTRLLPLSDGTSGSAWLVFTDLPKTQDVPTLTLQFPVEGVEHAVDVTGYYDARLAMSLERIGPRDALGLLTINGVLNSINVGTLVKAVDQLAAARVSRVVVAFGEDAAELDEPLGSWLRQTAQRIQTSRTYAMYPAVVSTIRELHIANLPGGGGGGGGGGGANDSVAHLHGTVAAAAEAALATAYGGLTADEIAAEIRDGDRLTQAATLAGGGADLPPRYLPLLLDRAASADHLLRRGALIALSGSGEPAAIAALAEHALANEQATAMLAIESLAASRYPAAHRALRELLDEPLAVDQKDLIRILSRYPRTQWSEYLASLATANEASAAPDVRREAILALGRTGHPRLVDILEEALESSEEPVRQAAFGLLLAREDPPSERAALEYALQQLDRGPPSPQMLQLFDRVRDPRIAPRLMDFLDATGEPRRDRAPLISALARIGPASIDEQLADRFDTFTPSEQAAVLTSLTQLRSDRLLPLASRSLQSEHDAVFTTAVRSLGMNASEQAVGHLAERLDAEQDVARVSGLAKALEDIGSGHAARALETSRNASSGEKREWIGKHLTSLRLKSPGGQHLRRAEAYAQEEEHAKALEHYTLAIERDPELAPAYSGRGHCRLKLEDFKQAAGDFQKAHALDPDDGLAIAGLGITLAVDGKVDEAVKTIEQAGERFSKDMLFAYNAACVFGRAVDHLRTASDKSAAQLERIRTLEEAALARLSSAVELGFTDLDWMRNDPDLTSLHGLERFQQLVQPETAEDAEPAEKKRSRPTQTQAPGQPDPQRTFAKPEPGEQ